MNLLYNENLTCGFSKRFSGSTWGSEVIGAARLPSVFITSALPVDLSLGPLFAQSVEIHYNTIELSEQSGNAEENSRQLASTERQARNKTYQASAKRGPSHHHQSSAWWINWSVVVSMNDPSRGVCGIMTRLMTEARSAEGWVGWPKMTKESH
jgi:hypothetical protein